MSDKKDEKDKKDSFVFYRSFYEAMDDMSNDEFTSIIRAVCEYAFDDKTPELGVYEKMAFKLIKPQIDASKQRYKVASEQGHHGIKGAEHGKKGGRPKKLKLKEKPQKNPSKNPLNVNVNENDNGNANVNPNEKQLLGHTPSSCDEVPEGYLFEGKTIRLNSGDYKQWLSQFTYLNEEQLIDELRLADVYYTENPPKNSKWFFPVYNWLKKAKRFTA